MPPKVTTPAAGAVMLNICRGSAFAALANSGDAVSKAATISDRFMTCPHGAPRRELSQGWTHETRGSVSHSA